MAKYQTNSKPLLIQSEPELLRLGETLGKKVVTGDLLFLSGPLGVGKTTLVKGIAVGLGVTMAVTSPTFLLQKTYPGRITLNHLDLYRLHQREELELLEVEELLSEGVTVVEWGELLAEQLKQDCLEVVLEFTSDPQQRRLNLKAHGPSSLKLLEELN